jgi:hypothetical protein
LKQLSGGHDKHVTIVLILMILMNCRWIQKGTHVNKHIKILISQFFVSSTCAGMMEEAVYETINSKSKKKKKIRENLWSLKRERCNEDYKYSRCPTKFHENGSDN